MVGFGCCTEEVKVSTKLYASMVDKGWLGKDGICKFDDSDVAHPSGCIAPRGFWEANPSQSRIRSALESGLIKFIDGNGDKKNAMTLAAYVAKYPDYPPPDLVLKVLGRFPPRFVKIGKY